MKGITKFLLSLLTLGLAILLVIFFLNPLRFYSASGDTVSSSIVQGRNSEDYSSYILPKASTSIDCDNLMNALVRSASTGKPFEVGSVSYGTDLSSQEALPKVGECPSKDLYVEVAPGIKQIVCRFNPITAYANVGVNDFGGISDSMSLSYDNCSYEYASYKSLVPSSTGPSTETVNTNPGTVNLYYSPDYLFIRNGDFSHYPSITNPNAFSNAYVGAGKMEVYVNKVLSSNGECKFNLYFCPIPAIAESTKDSTLEILRLFKTLEIYNVPMLPYYIREIDLSSSEEMPGYSSEVYSWSIYDIELDKDYRIETILNAVKEGMYSSVISNGYYFAHPHWDIQRAAIYPDVNECWDSGFDSLIKSSSSSLKTRSIRFNCGDDNICSGNLRIKIGIRKDSKETDIDNDGENDLLSYVSGVVSLCAL